MHNFLEKIRESFDKSICTRGSRCELFARQQRRADEFTFVN